MINLVTLVLAAWRPRVRWLLALLEQIPQLLGSLTWVMNVLVPLAAIIAAYLLSKYPPKRMLKWILGVVIILTSAVITMWVSYKIRTQVAEEATNRSDEAYSLADAEFKKANTEGKPDQNALTNALINMDQAIAKITSQIYLVVYYRFPEVHLRSTSVHLLRPTIRGKASDDIVNLVQEGREKKDAEILPLSGSLIGDVMRKGLEEYCPDVRPKDPVRAGCSTFKSTSSGVPGYASLFCYPLGGSSPEAKQDAGICFDSESPGAFDDEQAALIGTLTAQLNHLACLLDDFRDLLTQDATAQENAWLPQAAAPR